MEDFIPWRRDRSLKKTYSQIPPPASSTLLLLLSHSRIPGSQNQHIYSLFFALDRPLPHDHLHRFRCTYIIIIQALSLSFGSPYKQSMYSNHIPTSFSTDMHLFASDFGLCSSRQTCGPKSAACMCFYIGFHRAASAFDSCLRPSRIQTAAQCMQQFTWV